MKITIIGDTHGRKISEEIIESNLTSDKIILLGDYVDPYETMLELDIINHLKMIINYKKMYPKKFVLIIGNHDYHYINGLKSTRYNFLIEKTLNNLYSENWDLFDISYQIDNYLFTHAGVSNEWVAKNIDILESFGLEKNNSNIGEVLVKVHNSESSNILHQIGRSRFYHSNNLSGGITWADKSEIGWDYIPNIHQFVGHNQVVDIKRNGDDFSSITFCDTLGISGNYKVIELD